MNKWKPFLIQHFSDGEKQSDERNLGVEVEHFILKRDSGRAVTYSGRGGVRDILTKLIEAYPEAEVIPDDDFFGFKVPEFTVTLEPAAQLEISIAPMASIRKISEIYCIFRSQLDSILQEYGCMAVNTGCQPVSRVAELEMIPKRRYDLMNEYFMQFGTGGLEMMRGTASLQVSIDYSSEQDFRRKTQAVFYYAPMLKILCDNSGSFQGQPQKTKLKRTDIWRRVDSARCGILPHIFSDSYGYGDYADFLGAMPPIFIKEDRNIHITGSQTVSEIYDNRTMDEAECAHVLSMAFPDVRLKQYIEIRLADSVPLPFIQSYCALLKGLLYSETGLSFAKEQISKSRMTEADVLQAEDALMEKGWAAYIYGKPAKEAAAEILSIAVRNLPDNEAIYLKKFEKVLACGGICNIPD